jgi:SAM-dependent methyltransferase
MIAVWELLLGFIVLLVGAIYFVFGTFLWGAGYQPTWGRVAKRMLDLASVGPDDTLYDLGAGTGAILFRAARERGARVVGVEIEPIRVLILSLRRWIGGPRDRVKIRWGDLFGTSFREATVVALFLWPEAMHRLAPLLQSQLQPGARVVSYWHELPGWDPEVVDAKMRVYFYRWGGRAGASHPAPS